MIEPAAICLLPDPVQPVPSLRAGRAWSRLFPLCENGRRNAFGVNAECLRPRWSSAALLFCLAVCASHQHPDWAPSARLLTGPPCPLLGFSFLRDVVSFLKQVSGFYCFVLFFVLRVVFFNKILGFLFLLKYANLPEGEWKTKSWVLRPPTKQRWELPLAGSIFRGLNSKYHCGVKSVIQVHAGFLQQRVERWSGMKPSLLLSSSLWITGKVFGMQRIISAIWAEKPLTKCKLSTVNCTFFFFFKLCHVVPDTLQEKDWDLFSQMNGIIGDWTRSWTCPNPKMA